MPVAQTPPEITVTSSFSNSRACYHFLLRNEAIESMGMMVCVYFRILYSASAPPFHFAPLSFPPFQGVDLF